LIAFANPQAKDFQSVHDLHVQGMTITLDQENQSQGLVADIRRKHWQIFGVLILAVGLRIVVSSRTDPVAFDSAVYFEMAQLIREDAWKTVLSYPYPPLFPLLIAGLERIGVGTEAAGLFWSFGLNLAILMPLYFIARGLAGTRAALAALFLWAIHPYAVRLSARALSDAPTAFLVALALWSGLYALKARRLFWGVGAGMLSGLAYLARPEGLEAALVIAVLYVLSGTIASPSSSVSHRFFFRMAWVAAPLLGWALFASSYVANISTEAGAFTLSRKKSIQAMASSFVEPTSKAKPLPKTAHSEGPIAEPAPGIQSSWLRRAYQNTYVFQQPLVNGVYPVVLLLAVWGITTLRATKNPAQRATRRLLLNLGGLHLLVLVGVAGERGSDYLGGHHFFLLVLYLIPFAGAGLVAATDWTREHFPRLNRVPVTIAALCLAATLPASLRSRDYQGAGMRAAGTWVRNRISPTRIVVTNNVKFSFHAQARRLNLGNNVRDSVDRARSLGARFVGAHAHSPQASRLLELIHSGELELAATFSDRSATYQVYRILPKK
jgi:4-amino-4-deoxy-L-arabinose transferase-like glycosyltransferase